MNVILWSLVVVIVVVFSVGVAVQLHDRDAR